MIFNYLFYALEILILVRIVFSFVQVSPYHPTWGPVYRFVYNATEPLLGPIRRMLPPMGGLDFSPMVLLILADILRRLLISFL